MAERICNSVGPLQQTIQSEHPVPAHLHTWAKFQNLEPPSHTTVVIQQKEPLSTVQSGYFHGILGLLLGLGAPLVTPNGVNFLFFSSFHGISSHMPTCRVKVLSLFAMAGDIGTVASQLTKEFRLLLSTLPLLSQQSKHTVPVQRVSLDHLQCTYYTPHGWGGRGRAGV